MPTLVKGETDQSVTSVWQQGKCKGSFQTLSSLLASFKTPIRTLARVSLFCFKVHFISSAQYRPEDFLL